MTSHASIALTAALAGVAVLACSTVSAGSAAIPTATDGAVELLECTHGKRAVDRNALFRGEMSQLPGTHDMAMRFELSERVGRGAWRGVTARGLGVWRYSRPGVSRFAYRQRIAALARGTAYRVGITFEWRDETATVIQRQAATSPVCRQGGPLPNVRVAGLERLPGPTPETVRYVVSVVNRGRAPAPGLEVALLVDGAEVDTREMGKVAARRRREVAFVGPACTSAIAVELDPGDKLRELDKRDNARSFACAQAG
jgi:hypothetical protein